MNLRVTALDLPGQPTGILRRFLETRHAMARGFAIFLGGFASLNIIGERVAPGFDANIWWIDLAWLPAGGGEALITIVAIALLAFGLRPAAGALRRSITLVLACIACIATICNGAAFYLLLEEGILAEGFPVPFSLIVAGGLGLVIAALLSPESPNNRRRPLVLTGTVAACMVLFPLFQMFCFGRTNYQRPADAVVVFGARAYADGTPSTALADRVRTACMLYHQGLAPRLIFSGGPGDGSIHETEAMRRMAVELGVPGDAILLDPDGLNTGATAERTSVMLRRIGARRVLAVSHFYHLPRVKMAYHRLGWNVYTVPADESYTLTAMPIYMMREIAGLWVYYLGGFRNSNFSKHDETIRRPYLPDRPRYTGAYHRHQRNAPDHRRGG